MIRVFQMSKSKPSVQNGAVDIGNTKTGRPKVPIAWVPKSPDGGWGWVVVFGSFLIHIFTDGIVYSFGIMVVEFLHAFQEGRGLTSWIISILVGITLGAGTVCTHFVGVISNVQVNFTCTFKICFVALTVFWVCMCINNIHCIAFYQSEINMIT